tara:strand:+ start:6153 stop:7520 length:1368 start_codon:yes stop_codon:yes gene_type:complete
MKSFKQFTCLTEATKDEKSFVSYLRTNVFNNDKKFVARSRNGYHVRFPIDGSDSKIASFWKKHGILCVHDPEMDISGSFKEYLLTATDKMPGSDGSLTGKTLWYVNNSRKAASGGELIFGNKELTPDKVGLDGKTLALRGIKTTIKKFTDGLDKRIGNYLFSLVDLAGKTRGEESKIDFDIGLKPADLKVVSKDFGETIAAAWALKSNIVDASKIYFPAAGNEPLVDFYAVPKGGGMVGYSVKSGAGAGTSIKNIAEDLESKAADPKWMKSFSSTEQSVIRLVGHLHKTSATQGVIDANIAMGTPGIKALADAMGVRRPQRKSLGAITPDQINLWLQSIGTLEKRYEAAKKLYKIFGSETTWAIWKRIGRSNSQAAAIINPLGYHVVSHLNKAGQDTLNKAVKKLQVLQLDVNVTSTKLTFGVKSFKDMDFEFEYHSSISGGTSVSNKLGFKKKR